jgi:hypothetical protein
MNTENGAITNPRELQAAAQRERVLHVFDIPPSLRGLVGGAETMSMVELTADEEFMCLKRAGNSPMRLAFEYAKCSLRMLGKQPLSEVDGSADLVWNRMHPKVRSLALSAYGVLHTPADEDVAVFLESRRSTVG